MGDAMSDPNMDDFYGRVARIERAHAMGLGFEAEGTLGRSSTFRSRVKKRPVLRSALFVIALLFGLKGAILTQLGDDTYLGRVEALRQGDALDRVGAFVMQADPVTVWLAVQFRKVMP